MTDVLMLTYTTLPQTPDGQPLVHVSNVVIEGVIQKTATRDIKRNPRYVVRCEYLKLHTEFCDLIVTVRTYYEGQTGNFREFIRGLDGEFIDVSSFPDQNSVETEFRAGSEDEQFYMEALERGFRF